MTETIRKREDIEDEVNDVFHPDDEYYEEPDEDEPDWDSLEAQYYA
jgi:hypothetical protein